MTERRPIPLPAERLAALFGEAGSTSALARHLGEPYSTVRGWLVQAGLEPRRSGYRSPKTVSRRGPDHPNWRGGTYVTADGYVMEQAREHPDAPKNAGYVLQHRLVAERTLGRRLRPDELVHHRNHDKADNRPENLEVTDRSAHAHHHKDDAERTPRGRFAG